MSNLLNVTKNIIHCEFSDATHRVRLPTACLSIRKNACCKKMCQTKLIETRTNQIIGKVIRCYN